MVSASVVMALSLYSVFAPFKEVSVIVPLEVKKADVPADSCPGI